MRKLARIATFAVCTAALLAGAGCGLNHTHVPSDVQVLADQGLALQIEWRVQVRSPEMFGPDSYERGGVAVDGTGTRVVATTSAGDVIAIGARDGRELWRRSIVPEPFSAPPSITDGTVYVAAPDGSVRALRVESGAELWARQLGEVFHSAPAAFGDRVYVNTATGSLIALSAADGRVLWRVNQRGSAQLTVAGGGQPVAIGEQVYAGFPNGSLGRVDRDGQVTWLTDLANGEDRLRDVDTRPLIAGDSVYAASFSGGLASLDVTTGDQQWHLPLRGATSPVAYRDSLITTTADGEVFWVDPADGSIQYELDLDGDASGPAVRWGDYLFVTEPQDGLYVLAAARPWIHARFRPDPGFSSEAVARDGWVWALSNGGYVYGVSLVPL